MVNLSRQRDILNFRSDEWPLLVIGAGGIGSNSVYMAASMGFEHITVYEPDTIEPANYAPQFYGESHLYERKATELRFEIHNKLGILIKAFPELYARQSETARIVLCAVDSMPARRRIWKQHRIKGAEWWLDGRMGGTIWSLYCVNLRDSRQVACYEKTLDMPNGEIPCGEKATAFLTKGVIPGDIGVCLYHIVTDGQPFFYTTYDAFTMHREMGMEAWKV